MTSNCYSPLALFQYFFLQFQLSTVCTAVLDSETLPTAVTFPQYLGVFLLTCALEFPIYLSLLYFLKQKPSLTLIFLLNLSTHPFIFWVLPWAGHHFNWKMGSTIAISEIFAPLIEAMILWKVKRVPGKYALIGSLVANVASWWLALKII